MIVHVLNGNSEEYGLVKSSSGLQNGVSDIIQGYRSLFPGDRRAKNPLGRQCNMSGFFDIKHQNNT